MNDGLLGSGSVDRIVYDLTDALLTDLGALSRSAVAGLCELPFPPVPRCSSRLDGSFPESSSSSS